MRTVMRWLSVVVAVAGLMMLGNAATVFADEDDEQGLEQRVERLERQMHPLAEQREQGQRQSGEEFEHRGPPPRFEPDGQRGPAQCQSPARGPACGLRHGHHHPLCGLLCWIAFCIVVCNILLAMWVFTDIRKRGEGSGIFIVLALLIGIPAVVVYALVRIGDKKT